MEGVSCHFDHVSITSVMGHQVLTLGLFTDEGFLPVNFQIVISDVKAKPLSMTLKDDRNAAAQRYDEAIGQTQGVQMARGMIHRAFRHGIQAAYHVADAWFGAKEMTRVATELGTVAVLRMKRNKLQYCVPYGKGY